MVGFAFNTSTIRVVTIDGDPWFVAQDVCCILYDAVHVRSYGPSCRTQFLAKDEKRRVWANDPDYRNLFAGLRRVPSISLISESGFFKLVLRSDKPEARSFQDWVTRTVLPAIRKDGGYILGEEKVSAGELSPLSSPNAVSPSSALPFFDGDRVHPDNTQPKLISAPKGEPPVSTMGTPSLTFRSPRTAA